MRRNLFRSIRYAFQRVHHYYDERMLFEFDSYFRQFVPAIKEFCITELQHVEDPDGIYQNTLDLIEKWEDIEAEHDDHAEKYDTPEYDSDEMFSLMTQLQEVEKEFWTYFGAHIQYYWN